MLIEGNVVEVQHRIKLHRRPTSIQEFYVGKKGTVVNIDQDKDWPIHVKFPNGTEPMRICRFAEDELTALPDQRKMDRRQRDRRT